MTEIPFDCGVILFTNEEEVSRRRGVEHTTSVRVECCARGIAKNVATWDRSYFGGLFCGVSSSDRAPVVSGPVMVGIEAADVDPRAAVNHPRDK